MKLNKTGYFVLLWVTHIYIYSVVYSTLYKIISNIYIERWDFKHDLLFILVSPFFMTVIGGIPLFFIAYASLMYFLWKIKKQNWFKSYLISIVTLTIFMYLAMFFNETSKISVIGRIGQDDLVLSKLTFIVPSLLVTTSVIWLLFHKKFKKLYDE